MRVCFSARIFPTGLRTVHKVPSIWLWGLFEMIAREWQGFGSKLLSTTTICQICHALNTSTVYLYKSLKDLPMMKKGLKCQRSKIGNFGYMKSMHDNILDQVFGSKMKLLGSLHSSWEKLRKQQRWDYSHFQLSGTFFVVLPTSCTRQCATTMWMDTQVCAQSGAYFLDRESCTVQSVRLGKYFGINTICQYCAGGFNELTLLFWYADRTAMKQCHLLVQERMQR